MRCRGRRPRRPVNAPAAANVHGRIWNPPLRCRGCLLYTSIVSKRYLAGGGLTGSVALIGSTRMEYQRLLPILDYFAAKLGQSMAGQGQ